MKNNKNLTNSYFSSNDNIDFEIGTSNNNFKEEELEKQEAFEAVGVPVANEPSEIPSLLK